MNKIKLIGLMLFVSVGSFAQEVTEIMPNTTTKSKSLYSKKGDYILPQAGDISIGIDALPILEYMGNFFGKTTTNKLNISQTNIYGRYFLSEDIAVRANLDIHRKKTVAKNYIQDDKAVMINPISQAEVMDLYKKSSQEYRLTVGIQKSRGYGRLRGFAGAIAGYGLKINNGSFEYGNNITEINQKPTIADNTLWDGNNRMLNTSEKVNSFLIGAVGGVEYYFAPKICVGIEGHLMGNFVFSGRTKEQFEAWNGTGVATLDKKTGNKNKESNVDTDFGSKVSPSAGVYLMFSF